MSGRRIMLAAAMGFWTVCSGCAGQETSEKAAPAANSEAAKNAEPARPETARAARSATKQGTISLEGNQEPFTFELFDSSAASLPVAFTTYVPEDMIADLSRSGGSAVRFVANFGGRRRDQAYLEVSFYPASTAESEARRALSEQSPAGSAPAKAGSDVARRFSWSLAEHDISYRSKADGRMAGVAALGRHGDRFFRVTLHYPEEFGEGFNPRAYRILEEWRWGDTNEGL